ncbi:hypothetical protein [Micromonospora yangpuensis]|uniref:Uncharacterized protein n=1 Tax=Micromonospora yangpuensis TaxID=683228 RepID=A0A1C6US69_9ACTN|nr:hypothetical protein [Micromonospora yangpuensis]GGM06585.1 hypothetical protein GCM10012279_25600 [Micromonospora yangpuensis]SCL56790.1 hypothetical protein GA0070617_3343 [Micromonospora yangpuensis]
MPPTPPDLPTFDVTDWDAPQVSQAATMQSPQPQPQPSGRSFHEGVKEVVIGFRRGLNPLDPETRAKVDELVGQLNLGDKPTEGYEAEDEAVTGDLPLEPRERDRRNVYYLQEMRKHLEKAGSAQTTLGQTVQAAIDTFNRPRGDRSLPRHATAEKLLSRASTRRQPGGHVPYRPAGGQFGGPASGQGGRSGPGRV